MKLIRKLAVMAALFLSTANALAATPSPVAGEEYEIRRSYETSGQSSDGLSSSSSSGHTTILERVISVREDGLVLEYDLPGDTTAQERAREWQFPARVFRSSSGAVQLLNRTELEARVEAWLKSAGWTREVCGQWIFTWNAFQIECDPQSVVETIEALDLGSADLSVGALYEVPEASSPGTLVRTAAGPNDATYSVVMEVDPDAVRRARAEADVAVGEIMQKPVTLEAALRERANEQITGTITVTLETNSWGDVRSRTKVTKLVTRLPDGTSNSETAKEVLERHLVSGLAINPVNASKASDSN